MKAKIIVTVVIVLFFIVIAGFYVDSELRRGNIVSNNSGPSATSSEAVLGLSNYGKAPDFVGITNWLNSPPLSLSQLQGRVVLVDFWTYSCINCIRTLPYVTKWYDTYKNDGLVVVGVHTPEFDFEKDTANVENAINRFNIHYPVAQDNNYATWTAYNNQYWPAEYLIDKNGNIVHVNFGEGDYANTENAIRFLLGVGLTQNNNPTSSLDEVQSPEMYFGTNRLQNLTPGQSPSQLSKTYSLPQDVSLNQFALGGSWKFSQENAELTAGQGKIELKFHAGKAYIVAASQSGANLTIMVDGKSQPSVLVKSSKLYTLFDSSDYSDHTLEITISSPDFKAFTFTFG